MTRMQAIERRMRETEQRHDRCVPDGQQVVARLDGRGFGKLTTRLKLEKPYDAGFRDAMIGAARHLMGCGFQVAYAYTQSDEISVLFTPNEDSFARRHRKLLSVLAGEASAALSLHLGEPAAVDCRLLELGNGQDVLDYFHWRQVDARRNCRVSYAYWALRRQGRSGRQAHRAMLAMDDAAKLALVRDLDGITDEDVPAWQKHGIGLYHHEVEIVGLNPLTGEQAPARRRRIKVDLELPFGSAHGDLVDRLMCRPEPEAGDR